LEEAAHHPDEPVLIAITGAPGSGKTTLLKGVVTELLQEGFRCDGFYAVSTGGRTPGKGAETYFLERIPTGDRVHFAQRDEALLPPYRFNPDAQKVVETWAEAFKGVDVLVIDELGKLEAAGGGHTFYLSKLLEKRPRVVLAAVREDVISEIAQRFGRKFDAVFQAGAPETPRLLKTLLAGVPDWVRIGRFGAVSGGTEWSIGSALHIFAVPLRGIGLSATQAAVLAAAASRLKMPHRAGWVAFIAAGFKALSPSGSRFRPMLAIGMQGLLFALVLRVSGKITLLTVALAGFPVSAWAAMQGVVLSYALMGAVFLEAVEKSVGWLASALHFPAPQLPWLFVGWVVFCGVLSAMAAALSWRAFKYGNDRPLQQRAQVQTPMLFALATTSAKPWKRAARDLVRPVFLFPLGLVLAAAYLFAGKSIEQLALTAFRAVAVGWLVFSLGYAFPWERAAHFLRKCGFYGPALAFERAFGSKNSPTDLTPNG
jgi:nucleoside-triphosphatase THEP1